MSFFPENHTRHIRRQLGEVNDISTGANMLVMYDTTDFPPGPHSPVAGRS